MGHPCVNLPHGCPSPLTLSQQPFLFDPLRGSPMKAASRDGGSDCQPPPHQALRG